MLEAILSKLRRKNDSYPEPHEAESVKIIVGLGNPGQKYESTRHNLGFMVVDELRSRLTPEVNRDRFKAHLWEARRHGERIILVKPQTYMNLSGASVQQVQNWYKAAPEEILVVYDDLDLEFGSLRLRERGSAGGHNGLTSVMQSLGTSEIPRLRIGIGRGGAAAKARVLSSFSPAEREQLPDVIDRAASGVMTWLDEGAIAAMNHINVRPAAEKEAVATSAPAVKKEAT